LKCQDAAATRDFDRRTLLHRLTKAGWSIDPAQSLVIRASRALNEAAPWPFGPEPALPWPQEEILVAGWDAHLEEIDCGPGTEKSSAQFIRGDSLVVNSRLSCSLDERGGFAVSVGRTHTDNSPGLSILCRDGLLDPRQLVEGQSVLGVHTGVEAPRAWSYGRCA
jgi:hypothetical protein